MDGLPESADELGAADRAQLSFGHQSKKIKRESSDDERPTPEPTHLVPNAGRPPLRRALTTYGNKGGGGFQAAPDPLGGDNGNNPLLVLFDLIEFCGQVLNEAAS